MLFPLLYFNDEWAGFYPKSHWIWEYEFLAYYSKHINTIFPSYLTQQFGAFLRSPTDILNLQTFLKGVAISATWQGD